MDTQSNDETVLSNNNNNNNNNNYVPEEMCYICLDTKNLIQQQCKCRRLVHMECLQDFANVSQRSNNPDDNEYPSCSICKSVIANVHAHKESLWMVLGTIIQSVWKTCIQTIREHRYDGIIESFPVALYATTTVLSIWMALGGVIWVCVGSFGGIWLSLCYALLWVTIPFAVWPWYAFPVILYCIQWVYPTNIFDSQPFRIIINEEVKIAVHASTADTEEHIQEAERSIIEGIDVDRNIFLSTLYNNRTTEIDNHQPFSSQNTTTTTTVSSNTDESDDIQLEIAFQSSSNTNLDTETTNGNDGADDNNSTYNNNDDSEVMTENDDSSTVAWPSNTDEISPYEPQLDDILQNIYYPSDRQLYLSNNYSANYGATVFVRDGLICFSLLCLLERKRKHQGHRQSTLITWWPFLKAIFRLAFFSTVFLWICHRSIAFFILSHLPMIAQSSWTQFVCVSLLFYNEVFGFMGFPGTRTEYNREQTLIRDALFGTFGHNCTFSILWALLIGCLLSSLDAQFEVSWFGLCQCMCIMLLWHTALLHPQVMMSINSHVAVRQQIILTATIGFFDVLRMTTNYSVMMWKVLCVYTCGRIMWKCIWKPHYQWNDSFFDWTRAVSLAKVTQFISTLMAVSFSLFCLADIIYSHKQPTNSENVHPRMSLSVAIGLLWICYKAYPYIWIQLDSLSAIISTREETSTTTRTTTQQQQQLSSSVVMSYIIEWVRITSGIGSLMGFSYGVYLFFMRSIQIHAYSWAASLNSQWILVYCLAAYTCVSILLMAWMIAIMENSVALHDMLRPDQLYSMCTKCIRKGIALGTICTVSCLTARYVVEAMMVDTVRRPAIDIFAYTIIYPDAIYSNGPSFLTQWVHTTGVYMVLTTIQQLPDITGHSSILAQFCRENFWVLLFLLSFMVTGGLWNCSGFVSLSILCASITWMTYIQLTVWQSLNSFRRIRFSAGF